jgi:hypothetical protein
MEAPRGAWQRAAFVAVPLALVVLIFLTPGLIGRPNPQPTDIPFLIIRVTGGGWNATVNETALLYVQSALGFSMYTRLALAVTDADDSNATLESNALDVPSLVLKAPVLDGWAGNVTALAVKEEATFRFNATVEFAWEASGWILRVQPETATTSRDYREEFRTVMTREVPP